LNNYFGDTWAGDCKIRKVLSQKGGNKESALSIIKLSFYYCTTANRLSHQKKPKGENKHCGNNKNPK
jgi:hypothetical protein